MVVIVDIIQIVDIVDIVATVVSIVNILIINWNIEYTAVDVLLTNVTEHCCAISSEDAHIINITQSD